jgi:CHASE2 domain-containing sensor protein
MAEGSVGERVRLRRRRALVVGIVLAAACLGCVIGLLLGVRWMVGGVGVLIAFSLCSFWIYGRESRSS